MNAQATAHNGLARRIDRLVASPVREILAVIDQPGMVSFAGGLPATDNLPAPDVLDEKIARHTLQYGASEGEAALRTHISGMLSARGFDVDAEQVIILSGSQQGIDLVAKLAIDEGTTVAVESPTYLAALQTFSLFGARYLPFDVNDLATAFTHHQPALLYTNPTFRNPDSIVYSAAQRKHLAQTCDSMNTLVFEDDPYRELVYEECERTPVCASLNTASWVYQSSFSKTMAPGLRLGYLVCSPRLYTPLLRLKQAADLHSNRLSQHLVLKLLQSDESENRILALREDYRARRDNFDAMLTRHLSDLASWNTPCGGLFFWLTLKAQRAIDTRTLLPAALESGVAFMPGEPFFADGRSAANALRLNFSHADPDAVEPALEKLAKLLRSA